jgi:hypothetical protein
MGYKDPAKQREFNRLWVARRRAEYLSTKCCVVCGSKTDLEIDHIDPSKKISHTVWSWSIERRDQELSKCQVLCSNCHKEKTKRDFGYKSGHGTLSEYKKGCRCEVCRVNHSVAIKDWRKRVDYNHTRSDRPHK